MFAKTIRSHVSLNLLAVLVTISLVLPISSIPASAAPPLVGADGFIAPIDNNVPFDAIGISTAEELAEIGGTQSAGKYYYLENSIQLTTEWYPIRDFHGTFDGRGYTINNLYILSGSNRRLAGLFAQASEYAIIKNVGVNIGILGLFAYGSGGHEPVVVGPSPTSTIGSSASATVGGLVASSAGATISNCYANGAVTALGPLGGSAVAGGLIGSIINNDSAVLVENSYSSCTVTASTPSDENEYNDANSNSGGLIGVVSSFSGYEAVITNCYATGYSSASSGRGSAYSGGLIASSYNSTLTNCYAIGTTAVSISALRSSNRAYVGGLIGALRNGQIIDCFSESDVSASGRVYAGALIGLCRGGTMMITRSHATGRIDSSQTSDSCAGGLIGFIEAGVGVIVTNCYASGVVAVDGGRTGGVIAVSGSNSSLVVINSYYTNTTILGDTSVSIGVFVSPWALEGVMRAVDLGLVPESLQNNLTNATTRAEFAALAVTLYENVTERVIQTGSNPFDDTNDINAIKAAAIGVTIGTSATTFSPEDNLTREQAATMLSRLANALGKPLPRVAATFIDSDTVSSYAIEAVGQMQTTGIMDGVGDNQFSPKTPYTREQSIITILRLYDVVD